MQSFGSGGFAVIVMVQAVENGPAFDVGAGGRRWIGAAVGRDSADALVWAAVVVVIVDVILENSSQMGFAENEKMIETFSPDGANAPFDKSVGFGRSEWCFKSADTQSSAELLGKLVAILAIAVGQKKMRSSMVPGRLENC